MVYACPSRAACSMRLGFSARYREGEAGAWVCEAASCSQAHVLSTGCARVHHERQAFRSHVHS